MIVIPAGVAEELAKAGRDQEGQDEWQMEQIKQGVSLANLAPMPKK